MEGLLIGFRLTGERICLILQAFQSEHLVSRAKLPVNHSPPPVPGQQAQQLPFASKFFFRYDATDSFKTIWRGAPTKLNCRVRWAIPENMVFFRQRHALSMSFDISVVTYRVNSPVFGYCRSHAPTKLHIGLMGKC